MSQHHPIDAVYDTIVVGAGVMGSATARSLSQRGARVLLLEQFSLLHGRGSSHGETRVIRVDYLEPLLCRMAKAALESWRQLEEETATRIFVRCGYLMFCDARDPRAAFLDDAADVMRRCGIEATPLDAEQLAARFPGVNFTPNDVGLLDEASGTLRAQAAVRALQESARRHGAEILDGSPVTRVWRQNGVVNVEAGDVVFRAKKAVLTPGPWATKLLAKLGVAIKTTTLRIQVFYWKEEEEEGRGEGGREEDAKEEGEERKEKKSSEENEKERKELEEKKKGKRKEETGATSDAAAPNAKFGAKTKPEVAMEPDVAPAMEPETRMESEAKLEPGSGARAAHSPRPSPYHFSRLPVFVDFGGSPIGRPIIYGLPADEYPGCVKVCYHGGVPVSPDAPDAHDDEARAERAATKAMLSDFIGRRLPGIDATEPVVNDGCFYTETEDKGFVIDFVDGEGGDGHARKDIVYAVGFSGTGFKMAPEIGRLLADVVMETEPDLDLSFFSAKRFSGTEETLKFDRSTK